MADEFVEVEQTEENQARRFGELAGAALRVFGANPGLLAPPALFSCVTLLLYSLILGRFHSVVMGRINALGGQPDFIQFAAETALMLLSRRAVLLILVLIVVRVVMGAAHQAGWSAMFAAAAKNGAASMADYFGGVRSDAGRFAGAVVMKLCVHGIPALLLVLIGPATHILSADKVVIALPFFLLIEGFISFVFLMWRPSCAVDELGAGAALSEGSAFAFGCFADTAALYLLWTAFNLVPLAVLLAGAKVFFLNPLIAGFKIEAVAAGLPWLLCCAALSWMIFTLGAAFFSLLSFLLYSDRVEAVPVDVV